MSTRLPLPPPAPPTAAAVLTVLRRAVGLPCDEPTTRGPALDRLDAEGWLRWCEVGLELFSVLGDAPVPTLSLAGRAADRVVIELAEERVGDTIPALATALRAGQVMVRNRRADIERYPLAAPPMLRVRAEPEPTPAARELTETERMIDRLRGGG